MYSKLFAQILDSSIWLAPDPHRIVWITLLAAMDRHGVARFAAAENLSTRARVPLRETRRAIKAFESPDPFGLDQEYEGRRIERIDGGWLILNSEKYRNMVDSSVVATQTRERVRRHRERSKMSDPLNTDVTQRYAALRNVTVTPSYQIRSDQIKPQRAIKIASAEKPQELAPERTEAAAALKRIRERTCKSS
jgi:hypothetical protein